MRDTRRRRLFPPGWARTSRLKRSAAGDVVAVFNGFSVGLGKFSAGVVVAAQKLRKGLPLASLSPGEGAQNEIALLVRRLARRGLLEYRLGRARDAEDLIVIEPQVAAYWPQVPKLRDTDTLVLSRFAYMRRRGNEMVLESPRAGALFKICDPEIAAMLAMLAKPQSIKQMRRHSGFPGLALLAVLTDCRIVFKVDAAGDNSGLRPDEGGNDLVLWDFHDLLFHARSTEGRHANPTGGAYPYVGLIEPLPAVRPPWSGKKIDLRAFSNTSSEPTSPAAKLLRERHSTRDFDSERPITLAELSRFLDGAARVQSNWTTTLDPGGAGPTLAYTSRPYPSGGSSYELELYLAVDKCDGLARGFYHYDPAEHTLTPLVTRPQEFEALLKGAEQAMGAAAVPQILLIIAARFGRISWKYSSIAYGLILKDVGVLLQTLYLMATDLGLGGCAIGTTNIDLFERMTGIEFHVEGAVGQFALGRGMESAASDQQADPSQAGEGG